MARKWAYNLLLNTQELGNIYFILAYWLFSIKKNMAGIQTTHAAWSYTGEGVAHKDSSVWP